MPKFNIGDMVVIEHAMYKKNVKEKYTAIFKIKGFIGSYGKSYEQDLLLDGSYEIYCIFNNFIWNEVDTLRINYVDCQGRSATNAEKILYGK